MIAVKEHTRHGSFMHTHYGRGTTITAAFKDALSRSPYNKHGPSPRHVQTTLTELRRTGRASLGWADYSVERNA